MVFNPATAMPSFVALLQRRPRVFIAIAVAVMIVLVSSYTPAETIKVHTQKILQNNPFSSPYIFRDTGPLLDDAHRLRDADDFLAHFRAVVQYPSMPMVDAKAGCGWPDESVVNFQFAYDDSRDKDTGWVVRDKDDYEIELMRKQWQYFVANQMRPWSKFKGHFKGKGIVIPAGHEKSVKRVKVLMRMLKKLGSTLPVEIHYFGENELGDSIKQELADLLPEVYFNDLASNTSLIPTYYSPVSNFHLKIPAVINSRFAEVVLMDSDNIPVIDPAELFESDTYKEYGTIFWPDVARTRPNNPMWAITNTQCRGDEYEQESGQVLVDKRKYFYHLQLATWLEVEHRLYYDKIILGDKDMFRFAWHALKTKYGKPSRWITSVGTEYGDFFCGHSFAQHHPDPAGRVAFLHGGLLKTMSNTVIQWHLDHQGGIFQKFKRSRSDEEPWVNIGVRILWDQAKFLPEKKPDDYRVAWCTEIDNEPAQDLDKIIPGFQETFKEIGGYWMLDS